MSGARRRRIWELIPDWPEFDFADKDIDEGPVAGDQGASCWRGLQTALAGDFFNRSGIELIYRGHRRHEWQLTPTLRYDLQIAA